MNNLQNRDLMYHFMCRVENHVILCELILWCKEGKEKARNIAISGYIPSNLVHNVVQQVAL